LSLWTFPPGLRRGYTKIGKTVDARIEVGHCALCLFCHPTYASAGVGD
jgi:hypothetical protein